MNNSEINDILDKLSLSDIEELYAGLADYEKIPVSINEFIDNPYYLGNYFLENADSGGLYPYWRGKLNQIYPTPYHSPYWLVCFRGAVGLGKTTIGCLCLAYNIHKMLCMLNPQKTLGVLPTEMIVFLIFNATLTLAKDVVWDKVSQMFSTSPYFLEHIRGEFFVRSRDQFKTKNTLFPKRLHVEIASRITHALGKAINTMIIDEANFGIVSSQFVDNFNTGLRRIETRFMQKSGELFGQIFAISSESDKSAALNTLLSKYKKSKGVFVVADSIWEVKPHKYDDLGTFKVYTGSEVRDPHMIETEDDLVLTKESDAVIAVPNQHKESFDADLQGALRDLAGIAIGSNYKLFRLREKLHKALCVSQIFPDVISLDFDDKEDQIRNYMIHSNYFDKPFYPSKPRFIHLDMAQSGDRFGIGCSLITDFVEVSVRDPHTFEEVKEVLPKIMTEWAFTIQAKPGQQIPFFKVRMFILWLMQKKITLAAVTSDSFQCFTGGTKISLLNGTEVAIKDLVGKKEFYVYSCGIDGNVVPGKASNCRKTGEKVPILKITLDNGEEIRCTPNHKFMMRDGIYKEAQYLKPDDSLMPLYRRSDYGYESLWNPKTKQWRSAHLQVAKCIYPNFKPVRYEQDGHKIHHKDFNKRNNDPTNLHLCQNLKEHQGFHPGCPPEAIIALKKWWSTGSNRKERSNLVKEQVRKQWHDSEWAEWRDEFRLKQKEWAVPFDEVFKRRPDVLKKISEDATKRNLSDTPPRLIKWLTSELVIGKYEELKYKVSVARFFNVSVSVINRRLRGYIPKFEKDSKVRGGELSSKFLNSDKNIYIKRCRSILRHHGMCETDIKRRIDELVSKKYPVMNHKIVKIEDAGYEDVYDFEVDEYHNFALSAGVFVHNSTDTLQWARKMGLKGEVVSMDRTIAPYFSFRSALNEGRWVGPSSSLLAKELEDLEVSPDGKKIDHPSDCSKDLADGAGGSVYSALQEADKYKLVHMLQDTEDDDPMSGASEDYWNKHNAISQIFGDEIDGQIF